MKFLVHENGVAPTPCGESVLSHTALRGAAIGGHAKTVAFLLNECGVDVDVLSGGRRTALMAAAYYGCVVGVSEREREEREREREREKEKEKRRACAEIHSTGLVHRVHFPTLTFPHPLPHPTRSHAAVASLLLAHGADVSLRNSFGETAEDCARLQQHGAIAAEIAAASLLRGGGARSLL